MALLEMTCEIEEVFAAIDAMSGGSTWHLSIHVLIAKHNSLELQVEHTNRRGLPFVPMTRTINDWLKELVQLYAVESTFAYECRQDIFEEAIALSGDFESTVVLIDLIYDPCSVTEIKRFVIVCLPTRIETERYWSTFHEELETPLSARAGRLRETRC